MQEDFSMEEDMNVYKKVGRKYVPIGLRVGDHWLTDGIWIVRHKEHSIQQTNVGFLSQIYGMCKVGENATADLTKLADMEEYADVVSKVMFENENKPMTRQDLSRLIVKALFDFNENKKVK